MTADSIRDRMDVALDKARLRDIDPNVFYLTEEDWDAYNAELSAEWGSPRISFQYEDIQIRSGETSRLFGTRGEPVRIPKRLSHRVKAPAVTA